MSRCAWSRATSPTAGRAGCRPPTSTTPSPAAPRSRACSTAPTRRSSQGWTGAPRPGQGAAHPRGRARPAATGDGEAGGQGPGRDEHHHAHHRQRHGRRAQGGRQDDDRRQGFDDHPAGRAAQLHGLELPGADRVGGARGHGLAARRRRLLQRRSPASRNRARSSSPGPDGEREEVAGHRDGPGHRRLRGRPRWPSARRPWSRATASCRGGPSTSSMPRSSAAAAASPPTITLTEPVGVVFDSASNEPVAGAVVTLVAAAGGQCSAAAVAIDGNPATTDADGRYAFASAAAGDYCLLVAAPNGYVAPSKVPHGQLAARAQPRGHRAHVRRLVRPALPRERQRDRGGRAARSGRAVGPVRAEGGLARGGRPGRLRRLRGARAQRHRQRARPGERAAGRRSAGGLRVRERQRAQRRPHARRARRPAARVSSSAWAAWRGGRKPSVSYRVRVGPGAHAGRRHEPRRRPPTPPTAATTVSNVATARVQVDGRRLQRSRLHPRQGLPGLQRERRAGRGRDSACRACACSSRTEPTSSPTGRAATASTASRTARTRSRSTAPRFPPARALPAISARHLGDGGSRIVDLKAGEMHRGRFRDRRLRRPGRRRGEGAREGAGRWRRRARGDGGHAARHRGARRAGPQGACRRAAS